MKKYEKLPILDIADYLSDEDDIKGFLKPTFQSGDTEHITHALGIEARARNVSPVAKAAKMN